MLNSSLDKHLTNIEKQTNLQQIEKVSWSDNINNPQNIEFVNEVKFNNLTNEELQLQFCLRYYNCLSDSSKIWMSNQILKDK